MTFYEIHTLVVFLKISVVTCFFYEYKSWFWIIFSKKIKGQKILKSHTYFGLKIWAKKQLQFCIVDDDFVILKLFLIHVINRLKLNGVWVQPKNGFKCSKKIFYIILDEPSGKIWYGTHRTAVICAKQSSSALHCLNPLCAKVAVFPAAKQVG